MSRGLAADRFYSRWAAIYDHVSRKTPGVISLRRGLVERMQLRDGMTVLDLGCGPGPNFASLRSAAGPSGCIIGIDVAAGALKRAQTHVRNSGWGNVHVVRADARDPPITEVDAVVATFVVGMFDDPGSVIDDWCDAVGPGGRIGLLHFARSDQTFSQIPNALLAGLVLVSTPGKSRLRSDASRILDRRVREAHAALGERCTSVEHTTHWGGIIHIITGTVAN